MYELSENDTLMYETGVCLLWQTVDRSPVANDWFDICWFWIVIECCFSCQIRPFDDKSYGVRILEKVLGVYMPYIPHIVFVYFLDHVTLLEIIVLWLKTNKQTFIKKQVRKQFVLNFQRVIDFSFFCGLLRPAKLFFKRFAKRNSLLVKLFVNAQAESYWHSIKRYFKSWICSVAVDFIRCFVSHQFSLSDNCAFRVFLILAKWKNSIYNALCCTFQPAWIQSFLLNANSTSHTIFDVYNFTI